MPTIRYNFPCHHCGRPTPAGPQGLFLPTELARDLPARLIPLCKKCLARIQALPAEHAASAAVPSRDRLSELIFDHQDDDGNTRLRNFASATCPAASGR